MDAFTRAIQGRRGRRMTREEAISIMKVIVHMLEEKYDTDRVEEAVDMAIEALQQEPCEDDKPCTECPKYDHDNHNCSHFCHVIKGVLKEQPNKSEWQQDHEILKAYSDGANDMLCKIETEIEAMPKTYPFVNHFNAYIKVDDVKKILNKYKAEGSKAE